MENKEFGSDFHYNYGGDVKTDFFLDHGISNFFFSGRAAIYNLLKYGIEKYKWRKVGFPSYYCHEVVTFCADLPIAIEYYVYNPFSPPETVDWIDDSDSVFINVDYFGVHKLDVSFIHRSVVIEDLTHNLQSISTSTVDYVFASIRKQLPVPVGGFAFSKERNLVIDHVETEFASEVYLKKLTAMCLKSLYLKGEFIEKDVFRNYFLEAEKKFASKETDSLFPRLGRVYLESLDIPMIISKTRANVKLVKRFLVKSDLVELVTTNKNTEMGACFLCRDKSIRDEFRQYLIINKIYPAILWPNQLDELNTDYQNQMLFIHLDFRYSKKDIEYLILKINNFF